MINISVNRRETVSQDFLEGEYVGSKLLNSRGRVMQDEIFHVNF